MHEETATTNPQITTHYFDTYFANLDKEPILREAIAQRHFWEHAPIAISPEQLIVGTRPNDSNEIAGFFYGCGTYTNARRVDDYAATLPEEARPEFWAKIGTIRNNHHIASIWEDIEAAKDWAFTPEEVRGLKSGAAGSTFFGCHMVIDYEGILKGLSHYDKKINSYIKAGHNTEFYMAMKEILTGFCTYISRTGMACLNTTAHDDLIYISKHPPKHFRQALQLVWLAHCCAGADTFGRFDQYLYPFYDNDIRNGVITESEAYTYLLCLMDKINEAEQIQNMTIGGVLPDGSLGYNDLTRLILKAVREAGYQGPNLCFRISEHMPAHWWDEIMESLSFGQGIPALYNDEVMINQLIRANVDIADARNFCLAGCSQIMVPGKSQFANDIGMMNIAKILELTLYNGVDAAVSGIEMECKTGEVGTFATFEALQTAFCKQLSYYAKLEADVNNRAVAALSTNEGYAFRTLFTENCLEKGVGCFSGGAIYNHIQLECIGLTNAADSLAAIKKLVYEDNVITLPELCTALLADFEGCESLRKQCIDAPKFGNDDPFVDDLRRDITAHLFDALRAQPSVIGGHFIPGEVIFLAHGHQGENTGATPDGRKKGHVLADSAGAMQGADTKGPTALMNSVLKIPVTDICTTIPLNIKFLRQSFLKNRAKIQTLFRTFMAQGGQQLQVNVCDPVMLQDALKNPENHKNLIVRVGGFSTYFHTLPRNLQEEIVARNGY